MKILFLVNPMMMMMKIIYPNMIDVHIIVLIMLMVLLVEVGLVKIIYIEKNFSILGRGRGGRGHLTSTNTRLPPSTHFVRPQPELTSHSRSQLYSSSSTGLHHHHDTDSLEIELERTYAAALPRYYGTRNGQSTNSTDYGDFRISMFIKKEKVTFKNNIFI
jgi:hypothetical protein